jgi:hypothetical protein
MSHDQRPWPRSSLEISHRPKAIPYGGSGIRRSDGGANFGFKNLKGYPEFLDDVPELKRDAALRLLVSAINAPETATFSIGCLSAPVEDEHGYRVTGYVEFALNSRRAIADAANYFPAFFHFDRMLHRGAFVERVVFNWELAPAVFTDAGCEGFTAAIFVNTDYYPSRAEARACWERSLAVLQRFLSTSTIPDDDPVYLANTARETVSRDVDHEAGA